jgi:hypothetical protein
VIGTVISLIMSLYCLYSSVHAIRIGVIVGRGAPPVHRESNPVLFWFLVASVFGVGVVLLVSSALEVWWWQFGPANPP